MERRLAAILAADVVGFSRLMGADEAGTLERLKSLRRELVQPKITDRKGRIVKLRLSWRICGRSWWQVVASDLDRLKAQHG